MGTNEENASNRVDSEEEDYEIYFLQPASCPYDIKEKLEEANRALFEEILREEDRELRIKFKEDLIDYEPDLTDDDVQSFESYNEVDFGILEREDAALECLPGDPPTKLELNIFPPALIEEEEEECDTAEDEEEECVPTEEEERDNTQDDEEAEIFDEVNDDNNEIQFKLLEEESKVDSTISDELSSKDLISFDKDTSIESQSTIEKTPKSHSSKRSSMTYKKINIDCKSHCIEKLPGLNLTIGKLQINEKPVCPALKLLKRKCCEENQSKNDQKLPTYTGLRSEYGLSLAQLERRQRRKEFTKLREEKRRRLIEEYNQRKMQQNEEIFSQWLKTVEKRKRFEEKLRQNSRYCTKVVNSSKAANKERPKTANYCAKTLRKPQRPETACVYVQVSPDVLKRGLKIGNLIFKEYNTKDTSEMHIVSLEK